MPPRLKLFLQRWIINTLAVLVASSLVRGGIHYERPLDLVSASLLLGILNVFVRPLLVAVSFPLVVFSLGLFMFIINACLLYFVGWLLQPRFRVDTFGDALLGAVIITLMSMALNLLTGTSEARLEIRRGRAGGQDKTRPNLSKSDDPPGPTIDI